MKRLIDAYAGLFATSARADGKPGQTARLALDNVDWEGEPLRPEPLSQAIVDTQLAAACARSGPVGSDSRELAESLLAVAARLRWRPSSKNPEDGPDVALFMRSFSATTIIGAGGLLPSDRVFAGFSLQGPDTYYPPHAHEAEETYWIIGGEGDWKVGAKPWFAVRPGDTIYHESGARHAMQTNEQPMLAVWLWTSHLDSEVVIVRT